MTIFLRNIAALSSKSGIIWNGKVNYNERNKKIMTKKSQFEATLKSCVEAVENLNSDNVEQFIDESVISIECKKTFLNDEPNDIIITLSTSPLVVFDLENKQIKSLGKTVEINNNCEIIKEYLN
jgi:hypothetical protein